MKRIIKFFKWKNPTELIPNMRVNYGEPLQNGVLFHHVFSFAFFF
jgi:hypothetical protein